MCVNVRLYDLRGALAEQLSSDGRDEDIPTALDDFDRSFYSDEYGESARREINLIDKYFKEVN